MAMYRRRRTKFQSCMSHHLRGKRGGRTAFKKAVRACR